ncbi:ribosomal protection tetracycline resistance protein [Friedmanniella luteola]|uniref:Ribosomal protection tetracycline resistance protein n=1 Tax=Friedmanniella luteola TaxID=546871 RepID=A0A1H1LWL9_9ACTN|nr:TetM/TetW/TetO/TetS family tetracycline resistance ribosomal protection protein [Friedmanniella luteola]SDR78662.1 ribosomal protection tetracycline resistance protein [Friedmanniella luteola]
MPLLPTPARTLAPRTLVMGVVAHVDAGKTSLTERLLVAAGVLDRAGSVDAGDTQTDTMALERRRGITIRSAVATFVVDDVLVNLLDTPGHADFIAEVERALAMLDGAVLVVSAVEGVQAQTVKLHRALRRLGLPCVVFVNKCDRAGARPEDVVERVGRRLGVDVLALQEVVDAATAGVVVRPLPEAVLRSRATEVLAGHDDAVLAAFVDDRPLPAPELRRRLARATRGGLVLPVLCGSAITGAGVGELLAALPDLLPTHRPCADGPPAGSVFKIERGPAGEKLTHLVLRRGTVRVRDRLDLGHGRAERVTALALHSPGGAQPADALPAGRIARVRGLETARVGDVLGPVDRTPMRPVFSRPSLEAVVEPVEPARRGDLHAALAQLAEQDPLIEVRQDDSRGEIAVSLYGEVQKEVLGALLAEEYGVAVTFGTSSVLCVERVRRSGRAVERMGEVGNPFLATVGLRVEPAAFGAGLAFALEVERGAMPAAFFTAVEDGVRSALAAGPHGWPVPDVRVTMTHSGYAPRQSHAHQTFDKAMSSTGADFRYLTPLVLMTALLRAGSCVCEPVHRFTLEAPRVAQGAVLGVLAQLGAVPLDTGYEDGLVVVGGHVPASAVHDLRLRLPGLTSGEGSLTTGLDHLRPVLGPPPERPRIDHDPTDRETYLRTAARLAGRV